MVSIGGIRAKVFGTTPRGKWVRLVGLVSLPLLIKCGGGTLGAIRGCASPESYGVTASYETIKPHKIIGDVAVFRTRFEGMFLNLTVSEGVKLRLLDFKRLSLDEVEFSVKVLEAGKIEAPVFINGNRIGDLKIEAE